MPTPPPKKNKNIQNYLSYVLSSHYYELVFFTNESTYKNEEEFPISLLLFLYKKILTKDIVGETQISIRIETGNEDKKNRFEEQLN